MEITDDLRVAVRPGRTVDELVDRILDADAAVRATPGFVEALASEFALPFEHARLALRRDHGLAVDRGRLVREALAIALAELELHGEDSELVRRLNGWAQD